MSRLPQDDATSRGQAPGLVRAVGRWELVGLAINDVVGSGVYLLPAAAAALLGGVSVWAVPLAGLAVALLAFCFAEAASYFDEPGGAYLYTRTAFGPFVGFEVGWMTWLARVASVAALTNGLTLALGYVWAPAGEGWVRVLTMAAALAFLTWVNVVGVKAGARTAVTLVIGKMLPLLLFVVVGVFAIDWSLVRSAGEPAPGAFGRATLLLLFAYAGFENTPAAAGEYRNPRRDIPFALLAMLTTVTLTYTGVQLVALGTVPGLADVGSPLAAGARRFLGSWGVAIMTVGAVVSIVGNVGSTVLLGPRYLFALARDGYGPRILGRIHPRYRTPAVAIVTQTLIAFPLTLSGTFVQLALLSVIARLITYLGTAAAVPVLRRRFADRQDAFRLAGGATIPIAAICLSLGLLASGDWKNFVAALVAVGVGALLYRWRRTDGERRPTE